VLAAPPLLLDLRHGRQLSHPLSRHT